MKDNMTIYIINVYTQYGITEYYLLVWHTFSVHMQKLAQLVHFNLSR